jgi:hypothetical protein
MSSNLGRLQRVALGEVWKHEAQDFTKWLQNNMDVLNESLDLNLIWADRERPVGDFSADLVAEDEDGGTVVIENQLEKSNHDHLGKLITYLAAIGAKTAIWIVSDPRPDHVAAIGWLNASGSSKCPPSPLPSLTCPFHPRKIRASDRPNHLALPHRREAGRWRDGGCLQG